MPTIAGFFLGSLLAAASGAQPTPPPEIIHVQSDAFCTALHERLAPGIAALQQNDTTLEHGTKLLKQMSKDDGSLRMQMDELQLENDVSKAVRNLDAIYALIEVAPAADADAHTLEGLKNDLRKVADGQRDQINILNGTLESRQMDDLRSASSPIDASVTAAEFENSSGRGDAQTGSSANHPRPTASPGASLGESAHDASDAQKAAKKLEDAFTEHLMPLASRCNPKAAPPR